MSAEFRQEPLPAHPNLHLAIKIQSFRAIKSSRVVGARLRNLPNIRIIRNL